jgi:hypothetical protein
MVVDGGQKSERGRRKMRAALARERAVRQVERAGHRFEPGGRRSVCGWLSHLDEWNALCRGPRLRFP